jgi:methylthioribose-1-phosphate isomerase
MLQTIEWTGSAARLLDQTKLPTETVYVDITDEKQMHDAIRRLVIRGAPAIGVAAAFGVYLGVRNFRGGGENGPLFAFMDRLNEVCDYLATARPTAVNLFWAIDHMRRAARDAGRDSRAHDDNLTVDLIKSRLLAAAQAMLEDDTRVCRAIGEHGFALLQELSVPGNGPEMQILTHCNAGGLATVKYGTALAPIYVGAEKGTRFHVYADETRPLLQGSRITAWELKHNGIPVTVICDNMAATVMKEGKVSAVIVGTDRVAANGDVANKIGTMGVAILAKHFGIPFIVAAPTSSIDLSLETGAQIPIEQRDAREVSEGLGKQTAPSDVDIYNPAFDVTPNDLVTAIVTEKGVVRAPYVEGLRQVMQVPGATARQ